MCHCQPSTPLVTKSRFTILSNQSGVTIYYIQSDKSSFYSIELSLLTELVKYILLQQTAINTGRKKQLENFWCDFMGNYMSCKTFIADFIVIVQQLEQTKFERTTNDWFWKEA